MKKLIPLAALTLSFALVSPAIADDKESKKDKPKSEASEQAERKRRLMELMKKRRDADREHAGREKNPTPAGITIPSELNAKVAPDETNRNAKPAIEFTARKGNTRKHAVEAALRNANTRNGDAATTAPNVTSPK